MRTVPGGPSGAAVVVVVACADAGGVVVAGIVPGTAVADAPVVGEVGELVAAPLQAAIATAAPAATSTLPQRTPPTVPGRPAGDPAASAQRGGAVPA
jgi:hypothetical protein